MSVLIVGSGGREHALAWKLSQSPHVSRLFIAPGNAGTATLGSNLPISDSDVPGLVDATRGHGIALTVIGPEAPLAAGIVDAFQAEDLLVFGPTQAAARIETSKAWAKGFMSRHGIPTAEYREIATVEEAERFLDEIPEGPMAVKADGLAAGKGVILAKSRPEILDAVRSMSSGAFGDAGRRIVLEELLEGPEVSVFAFVRGHQISPLVAACDYKRIGDGDTGPNTGGMGAYSPPEFWTAELAERVRAEIMAPTVAGMDDERCPFSGVLYAGLMLTEAGPKVLEFNCRLGDPEAGVVLPKLRADLYEVCSAVAAGRFDPSAVAWSEDAYTSVVMASGGYPGEYEKGTPIDGLDEAAREALIFHAGTASASLGRVVTAGGRVLGVVSGGRDVREARSKAYGALSKIRFEGAVYRRDIGARVAQASSRI